MNKLIKIYATEILLKINKKYNANIVKLKHVNGVPDYLHHIKLKIQKQKNLILQQIKNKNHKFHNNHNKNKYNNQNLLKKYKLHLLH